MLYMSRFFPLLLIALFVFPSSLFAQDTPTAADAEALFQAEKWQEAAAAFEQVIEQNPNNPTPWFRLGVVYRNLGSMDKAIAHYQRMIDNNQFVPFARFAMAKTYAIQQDKEATLRTLEQAVSEGFTNLQTLQSDADFAFVRSDTRYESAIITIDKQARPCEYASAHRQFDFWVGEWNVYSPQGQLAGTNSIQKAENGCVLMEKWTSASGGGGTSINYYNPETKKWVQHWVASTYFGIFEGGLREANVMHLSGKVIPVNGASYLLRGTWSLLEDGRVRQFFEQSNDDGMTWSTWFDGYYVRQDADGSTP